MSGGNTHAEAKVNVLKGELVLTGATPTLPAIKLGEYEVSRLILGGNPLSGFSHTSDELNWEMASYYTMPRLQETLQEAWRCGINTVAARGDHHIMRMILEHHLSGGSGIIPLP